MFNKNQSEDKFYKKFIEQAENVLEGTIVLKDFLNTMDNETIYTQKMQTLERKGDQIVHEVIAELNDTFVTPMDREDIYKLTKRFDDCIDYTDSIVNSFIIYNVSKCTDAAKVFADYIVECAKEVLELMKILSLMKKKHEKKIIHNKIIEINKIEHKADILFRDTVGKMFREEEIDVLEIIKWKDLYQAFENTVDSFEAVVNIIGGIIMKTA
ncbi:DUF47 family protein [uncultured Clostridium sp.]|jgi:hypothetical protein|uniref:DUF47 domain-containing protein n=1 Tax=uncultured Clostridium sp. TaxID=59620 RepID=UPI00262F70E6|nr:DUF47 family protein [uncultured Clostridium sp.]